MPRPRPADLAYRKALGIGEADPLPKAHGAVTRNAASLKRPRKTAIYR
ncbi:hypothetical protein FDI09_gp21 [Mycobacterium phage Twister]|uniref:Uncharacterized protein n=4 Tax=Fromanvirus TaxID=186764 RepID=H9NCM6_9CAUD|nr:hypothetical protein FDI09_gp21 [Mycobacterium phage Twister]YP_009638903.1 hypothetical protein FGG47_gp20 [Mycobacterium phage Rebeuca]QBP32021.1 hypothetical protein SEA_KRISTOFF_72 [Mycobacterium phage Kristoff]QGJ94747.1 hypothetical protein SEA_WALTERMCMICKEY_73 [Mycobacterium phage WalterMcMickey]AFF28347.1 hypothetical protein TWISTER_74 [Mycobacterium phage Twister]AFQ97380.1 hypothetical protein REBEUCA_75 [Mycobacterium phage Rebeuca]